MKQPLAQLLTKASKALPPQRPKTADYSDFKKVAVKMHYRGHTPRTIVDFLIERREIEASERKAATASIRELITNHVGK
jgi:hypothetical protein